MRAPKPATRTLGAARQRAESRFAKALERRVLRFIQGHAVLRPGERVLVGVSGGPDSTVLLLTLSHLQEALGIELAVAHYDHRLRSRGQAEEDVRYVRHLADSLGLPLALGQGNVRAQARTQRLSLEEAGRHLRYAFLAQEAQRRGAGVVAVGHTASDQAETVLLHVVRGAGLEGLAAMAPRSPWPLGEGPELARPLLEVSREEIYRYCREEGIEPRQDPTNLLLEAARNRVRHRLLPALRELNPNVEAALCRLATAAAADAAYLQAAADALWPSLARERDDWVAFPRQRLAELDDAIVSRLLRRAVRRLAGAAADLEAVHLQALAEALGKRRARVSLAHGLTGVVRGDELYITVAGAEPGREPAIAETGLALPGHTRVGRWVVEAEYVSPPVEPIAAGPYEAYLDAAMAGPRLTVRSRRPGDRLRPLGLGGEKKVQDLLVDAKVPVEKRDAVPIVCAPWGIVWVVGHRIDQRAAVREGTGQVLHLRFVLLGEPRSA